MRTMLAAMAALLLSGNAPPQGRSWAQVSTSGPPAQRSQTMDFDARLGLTILHDGQGGSTSTWAWDGQVWTLLTSTGPPRRSGAAMAFDNNRSRTVLFAGIDLASAGYLQDTWEFDGTLWVPRFAITRPAPRTGHAMTYDIQRAKVVLFGGNGGTAGTISFGDTWEWDGVSWVNASNTGPSPRYWHAMAYDSTRSRSVMFGGQAAPNETWEWDGSMWLRIPAGPGARFWHAMTFDTVRGQTILFGGYNSSGFLGDTWEWNGTVWSSLGIAGPTRKEHAMVFDPARDTITLFGGESATTPFLSDTWELGFTMVAAATTFGSSCGSPGLLMSPDPTARPILGMLARAVLSNIPGTIYGFGAGLSNQVSFGIPLPLDLAPFGMPGCTLLQSSEAMSFASGQTGQATFSLAIPANPTLLGLPIFIQGVANAPGANVGNTIASNGIEWVIGNT